MKGFKIVGLIFFVLGIFFAIIGTVEYISVLNASENRVYTTATIVEIDEYLTNDPDNRKGYNVYVEYKVNDTTVKSKLNTYSSKYYVGIEVPIYYYENDMNMVYEKNSEHFLLLFPLVGILFSVIGVVLLFNKQVQNFLLRLPVSEDI